jgi:5'-phosphate synthase pdxT subunit
VKPTVGVLAMQGAFALHARVLSELGARAPEVRTPADLARVDALVMPGGESTTMSMLLESSGCSTRWRRGSTAGCRCSAPAPA